MENRFFTVTALVTTAIQCDDQFTINLVTKQQAYKDQNERQKTTVWNEH